MQEEKRTSMNTDQEKHEENKEEDQERREREGEKGKTMHRREHSSTEENQIKVWVDLNIIAKSKAGFVDRTIKINFFFFTQPFLQIFLRKYSMKC